MDTELPIETDISIPDAPNEATDEEEDTEGQHRNHRRRLRRAAYPEPDALDETRLMELMLFETMPRCDTNPIAKALLEQCGGMEGLIECTPTARAAIDALGEQTAVYLKAITILCRRYAKKPFSKLPEFNTLTEARQWMRTAYWPALRPTLTVLSLDNNLKPLRALSFSLQTAPEPHTFARNVARDVFTEDSRFLFFTFSHPGGLLAPTREEVQMLLALSDLCLPQAAFLAEAVIVNADGAKYMSASPIFPIGTFLQFEGDPSR